MVDSAGPKKEIVDLNNDINHSTITDIYRIFYPIATKYTAHKHHSLVRPHSGPQNRLTKFEIEITQNMFLYCNGTQLEINNKR